MKPLELTVFEKEPGRYGGEPRYNSPDGFWAYPASHVDGYAQEKRLTDAELAAEVWMQYWGAMPFIKDGKGNSRGKYDRQRIIDRFATLPNYDDEDHQ